MPDPLRILFVEPFFGGSHQAFAKSWQTHSRHRIEVFGLPAYKWKWRMRHAPLTLANDINAAVLEGKAWDVLVCSDMLALAEFKGLVRSQVAELPTVLYFHENQLSYPTSNGKLESRDFHFAYSNFVSAVCADENWFNSQFHLDEFYSEMYAWLVRMPDYRETNELERAKRKSLVQHPGIDICASANGRPANKNRNESFTILWPHRWEFDKNPEDFFAALTLLDSRIDFRLIVLGESFRNQPKVFEAARQEFAHRIDHWGFVETRQEYLKLLGQATIAVSTARHEFFGMAMLEAAAVGVIPVVPDRLAYPEIFQAGNPASELFFYDGSVDGLVEAILALVERVSSRSDLASIHEHLQKLTRPFHWPLRASLMDGRLEALCARSAKS